MKVEYETSKWGVSVVVEGEEVDLFETMEEARRFVESRMYLYDLDSMLRERADTDESNNF